MNIQLFLEGQEVELNNGVSIPLNKTYSNLYNPTDIVVEYSKSINIPMTSYNNKVFGQLFKLDRTIVSNNNSSIGLYLDPNKKIKALLMYNGDVVLEGYAKYVSSEYSSSGKYYIINVFGVLGDIFYKLKQITVTDSTSDYYYDFGLSGQLPIDKYYVKNSWYNEYPILDANSVEVEDIDILGFAPAYRGLYPNFKSDTIEMQNGEMRSMSAYLDTLWSDKVAFQMFDTAYNGCTDSQKKAVDEYVKGLDSKSAIGSGMKDYQMREYRSYHMRPYIYFNKLMQGFKNWTDRNTDYTMNLDSSWFNTNNPYWTNMCYMFDYNTQRAEQVKTKLNGSNMVWERNNYSGYNAVYLTGTYAMTLGSMSAGDKITVAEQKIRIIHNNVYDVSSGAYSYQLQYGINNGYAHPELKIYPKTRYRIQVRLIDSGNNVADMKEYWSCPEGGQFDLQTSTYTPTNFVTMQETGNNVSGNVSGTSYYTSKEIFFEIPTSTLIAPSSSTYKIRYLVEIQGDSTYQRWGDTVIPQFSIPGYTTVPETTFPWSYSASSTNINPNNTNNYFITSSTGTAFQPEDAYKITGGNNSKHSTLADFYNEDKPLFDVVLEYTKMFGLMWDIDYHTKTINVVPRGKYFTDYTTTNWTDKLDKSNGYSISPVVFPNKYINFSYEDQDGYRYTKYQDKYDANYGAKRVKTNYEFDDKNNDLFTDVKPSMTSNRDFLLWDTLKGWDTHSIMNLTTDNAERIECANEEDSQSAYVNNWFIRGANTSTYAIISDDTANQIGKDQYCYISGFADEYNDCTIITNYIPTFTAAYEKDGVYYGLLFNTPKEDYTTDHKYTECNGSYLYDKYWNRYINERYNVQNKKLTAYFKLTPMDYINLKFNRFVVIENQLFIVNKVFDYDINNNSPVKVELIQITDITGYANNDGLFEGFYVDPTGINVTEAAASGSRTIHAHSEDPVYASLITTSASASGTVTLYNQGTDQSGMSTYSLSWSGLGSTDTYVGYIHFTSGNQVIDVPVRIERGTYYTITFEVTPDDAEFTYTII